MNYEAWPLDLKLLELLPDKGLIGGIHWKGRRVKDLAEQINTELGEGLVNSTAVNSRMRVMKQAGLVEMHPATGGRIWSRTDKGRQLLEERDGNEEES